MLFILFLSVFSIEFWAVNGQANFTGHKVLGVFASDEKELKLLQSLNGNADVDFWSEPFSLYEKVNIRVPPHYSKQLEDEFRAAGLDYYVVTDNLQDWIDVERDENPSDEEWTGRQQAFRLDVYHTNDAINAYMDSAAQKYASFVSTQYYGSTYEGNPIRGLKIGNQGTNKPAIWIDSGIHAREWVAPATSLYIIEQLLVGADSDPQIKTFLDKFDWYFLPVANPDGYQYTWTNNRMWRKNRARQGFSPFCRGVDPNRNFDSEFGGPGTSSDVCSEIYRGPEAFSEAESRAIRDGILAIGKGKVKAFFTMHSYSQLWMTPYGHSRHNTAHHEDQMKALRLATSAIQNKHGMYYRHGPVATTIYPAAGSSIDWAYDAADVKYSFAIELRDTGRQGFVLSNSHIIPNAEENWEGIKAVAELILKEEEQAGRRFSVKS